MVKNGSDRHRYIEVGVPVAILTGENGSSPDCKKLRDFRGGPLHCKSLLSDLLAEKGTLFSTNGLPDVPDTLSFQKGDIVKAKLQGGMDKKSTQLYVEKRAVSPGTHGETSVSQAGFTRQDSMGRELEENYDLLEKIGRGSSGQVFRARRKADEKEVALKVMSATSPDVVASRRAEFEILSHLSHPNIVQGLDFFCSGSTAVIALSYHSGSTLSRAVRDSASSCLMEADSKRLFRKLISAVSYLHEHRIVHRDVKADNIL
ncbi:Serine/threonine-protein kinase 36, partial [Symbiodinium microadriaticum]